MRDQSDLAEALAAIAAHGYTEKANDIAQREGITEEEMAEAGVQIRRC